MDAEPNAEAEKVRADFRLQDSGFVALIDGAFADAAKRSGPHLLCRPGCTQCCIGAFAIGPADALRLQTGLTALKQENPDRAARIQQRATASWSRLAPRFPGDASSGLLRTDQDGEPVPDFEDFANEEPCPVLDPEHGTCDLYAARPQICRLFGPPIAVDGGFGICELCFQHASEQEIADAAISAPSSEHSAVLDRVATAAGQSPGQTIIAFVLKA
jgi:Fe-S-cluster containining protein